MVTPMTEQGGLDEATVGRVIDHLLAGGVHGVFVLGTTGEMPSLPRPLRRRLVELTVARVGAKAVTYAGVSDTCLAESVEAADAYFDLGVDVYERMNALPTVVTGNPKDLEQMSPGTKRIFDRAKAARAGW